MMLLAATAQSSPISDIVTRDFATDNSLCEKVGVIVTLLKKHKVVPFVVPEHTSEGFDDYSVVGFSLG